LNKELTVPTPKKPKPKATPRQPDSYTRYILEKIRRSEESLKRGGISHEEVPRLAAEWAK
jgi:hypothetical protein